YPLRVASDDFDGISSRQPGVVVVLSQEERKLLVAEHWLVTGVRYQQPSLFEGGHGDHPSHSDGSTLAIRISPARGKVGNTSAAAFVQCAGGSFVSQISPKMPAASPKLMTPDRTARSASAVGANRVSPSLSGGSITK